MKETVCYRCACAEHECGVNGLDLGFQLIVSSVGLQRACPVCTRMYEVKFLDGARRMSRVLGHGGMKGVADLNASDTQYEMKLVTPHFRAWRGTGSRSLFVLSNISAPFHLNFVGCCNERCIPSRIPLRKSRFRLLDLECEIRLLNDCHCAPTTTE